MKVPMSFTTAFDPAKSFFPVNSTPPLSYQKERYRDIEREMDWEEEEYEEKLMVYCIKIDKERLRDYFAMFGPVSRAVVMRNRVTRKHKGFGFVVFSDPFVINTVLQYHHFIDGQKVEIRRALSDRHNDSTSGKNNSNLSKSGIRENERAKSIFITGFCPTLTKEQFHFHFQSYGIVTDILLMCDQKTEKAEHCGFGFISFENENALDKVLHKAFHNIFGVLVEVKRALIQKADNGASGSVTGGTEGDGALPRNLLDDGKIINNKKSVFKIFVGGLPRTMTEEDVRNYFKTFGYIDEVKLMPEQKKPQRNRGYGFISFSSEDSVKRVLENSFHDINGKKVEVKRISEDLNPNNGGKSETSGNERTKKIFVGGLSKKVTEESFRKYFEDYGVVTEALLMYDQRTQKRPRGFGFILFQSEDSVDRALRKEIHEIDGKQVEIKRAYPKDKNSGNPPGRSMGVAMTVHTHDLFAGDFGPSVYPLYRADDYVDESYSARIFQF